MMAPPLRQTRRRHYATKYRVLYSFGSDIGSGGAYPLAGLIDVKGTLYGTTAFGGAGSSAGYGTIFSINTAGRETALYGFTGGSDGAFPASGLIDVGGTLYGTTAEDGEYGSIYGDGTVFSVGKRGKNLRVLHTFSGGSDGKYPMAGLVDIKGVLYGTTREGGAYGHGTVFSVCIANGKERVLHSFGSGSDGAYPLAGLVHMGNTLYGTTENGGKSDRGTVFSITTSGAETVTHVFGTRSDGRNPVAGLMNLSGELYGTTEYGGTRNWGTIFRISTSGVERVLHSFKNNGADGIRPEAGLIAVSGKIYGTTYAGGSCGASFGCGTVFTVAANGKERVLHSFAHNYNGDGEHPMASLVYLNGTLYGTTYSGGISPPSCPISGGCYYGTVFALQP